MSLKPRSLAPLLIAIASVALAPVAAADPPLPTAGSESASATIKDLRAAGYSVRINWVNGSPDEPLSECQTTSIDTSAPPTAWVSVECPEAGD
jgi:hypothetical protein